jgi:hypothetical protein
MFETVRVPGSPVRQLAVARRVASVAASPVSLTTSEINLLAAAFNQTATS